jgi:hypothetical protein
MSTMISSNIIANIAIFCKVVSFAFEHNNKYCLPPLSNFLTKISRYVNVIFFIIAALYFFKEGFSIYILVDVVLATVAFGAIATKLHLIFVQYVVTICFAVSLPMIVLAFIE